MGNAPSHQSDDLSVDESRVPLGSTDINKPARSIYYRIGKKR
ncbi:MAG: hypothetical protein QXI22_00250 [Sulfolobales archaeon]